MATPTPVTHLNKVQTLAYLHLEKSPTYLHKLVQGDKLHPISQPHPTLPNIMRNMYPIAELDAYLATKGTGGVGKRTDGRNKFVYYATPAELAKANAALKAAGLPELTKAPVHKAKKAAK